MKFKLENLLPHLDELDVALDRQLEVLQTKRLQMERLFVTLARSDNEAMEPLLAAMEETQQQQVHADAQLFLLRTALAGVLGCQERQLRLSELAQALPSPHGQRLLDRRQAVIEAVERLRRQHMETTLLLRQCQRLSRMLIESVLHGQNDSLTYGGNGQVQTREAGGLMNAEL